MHSPQNDDKVTDGPGPHFPSCADRIKEFQKTGLANIVAFCETDMGYINGEWRSWYHFGNGALGDWGAHIFDTAHRFLKLGLPTELKPIMLEGHSTFIFPQASTLAFRFPALV